MDKNQRVEQRVFDWDKMRYLDPVEVRAKQRVSRDRWMTRVLVAGLSLIVYLFWGDLAWLGFVWFTIPFWL